MKNFIVLISAIFITLSCQKGPDPQRNIEMENALKTIDSVYSEIFTILSDSKETSEKTIENAGKIITEKSDKLTQASKALQKELTLEQQSILMDFNKDIMEKSVKPAEKLLSASKNKQETVKKIESIFSSIYQYHKFDVKK
jgi:F0F1-type ATP synthase membrane subunit b/b'